MSKKSVAQRRPPAAPSAERISRWTRVRVLLPDILEYGRAEGILKPLPAEASDGAAGLAAVIAQAQEDDDNDSDRPQRPNGDKVNLSTNDISMSHHAIPFLPVPIAAFCFFLNIVLAGSGTIMSGFFGLVIGQPRVTVKEGRAMFALVINAFIGVAQFMTVSLFLVGWGWSLAWGGLMVVHAMEYRRALLARRKEAVATAAVEALTKDSIMHKKDVKNMF